VHQARDNNRCGSFRVLVRIFVYLEERMNPQQVVCESSRLIEQTNQLGIDFLLTDLDLGLTFLQVARVTHFAESRSRNFDKAYRVYRTVMHLLPRVHPPPDVRLALEKKLEDLKNHLEEAGYCSPESEVDCH
jgi:hypothetical protein